MSNGLCFLTILSKQVHAERMQTNIASAQRVVHSAFTDTMPIRVLIQDLKDAASNACE